VLDGSFVSIGAISPGKEHAIIVNSLSKNMGISGWRIGYVIGHPEFIQVLLKINQHLITCAPTLLLLYCDRYFDDILAHTLPQARAVVEKRARVAKQLEALGLEALPGGATFYFFVSLGDYPGTSLDCATELLQTHGVSVVPGFAYGKSMDRFVRVGIGTESEERIRIGLERIKQVITGTRASGVVFTTEQVLECAPESGPAPDASSSGRPSPGGGTSARRAAAKRSRKSGAPTAH
jgi:aspartate aminotransferase/aminotransferase